MEKNVADNLLTLVDQYNKHFPTSFKKLDNMEKYSDDEDIFVSDRHYEKFMSFDESTTKVDLDIEVLKKYIAHTTNSLYSWKWHKKIYEIDSELSDLLLEQYIGDMQIESDIIRKLPFSGMCLHMNNYEDIFAIARIDYFKGDTKALYFTIFYNETVNEADEQDRITVPIVRIIPLIEGLTVAQCAQRVKYKLDSAEDEENARLFSIQLLNILMYILSASADVKKSITIPTLNIDRHRKKYKRVLEELEVFEVGFVIGETIRMHKNTNTSSNNKRKIDPFETRTGSTAFKCPHVRCGHWQHYWVGKRGCQTRILKWVHPCLVNTLTKESINVCVNPVKI